MHSSKVYLKLNERLGLNDHSTVLNIMLRCVGVLWVQWVGCVGWAGTDAGRNAAVVQRVGL